MKLDVISNKISSLGMLDLVKSITNVFLSLLDYVMDTATVKAVVYIMAHSVALNSIFLDHCGIVTEGESHMAVGIILM